MQNILNVFKSRTVWTIIVLFVINGVSGVHDLIPSVALPFVDAVIGLAGIYFRVNPNATFNK